jgi:hypothetical protein
MQRKTQIQTQLCTNAMKDAQKNRALFSAQLAAFSERRR